VVTEELKQLRNKNLVIALDGHSSSGKSTLSKDISGVLEIPHIDSGAMYRAVTLYCIKEDIDISNESMIAKSLDLINISFRVEDGKNVTMLNGTNVEEQIRTMAVSENVSAIAAISGVRSQMVDQQRSMAQSSGLIMDGRDIGTVVFPQADVKLFVTASTEVRTERRHQELLSKGQDISKAEVRLNLVSRDHIDSTRDDSPLRQAADAVILDTTALQLIHDNVKSDRDV